jgi:hypothetical protein
MHAHARAARLVATAATRRGLPLLSRRRRIRGYSLLVQHSNGTLDKKRPWRDAAAPAVDQHAGSMPQGWSGGGGGFFILKERGARFSPARAGRSRRHTVEVLSGACSILDESATAGRSGCRGAKATHWIAAPGGAARLTREGDAGRSPCVELSYSFDARLCPIEGTRHGPKCMSCVSHTEVFSVLNSIYIFPASLLHRFIPEDCSALDRETAFFNSIATKGLRRLDHNPAPIASLKITAPSPPPLPGYRSSR